MLAYALSGLVWSQLELGLYQCEHRQLQVARGTSVRAPFPEREVLHVRCESIQGQVFQRVRPEHTCCTKAGNTAGGA